MELVTFIPLCHHNIHSLVWNWSPLHHCIIIISIHWYGTGHLYTIVSSQYPFTRIELVTITPLCHHNIHTLVWNWSPLHLCIIIISIQWYGTGHLYTIVSSQYPCTGMELVTSTPLYHHNIHALVWNWSPLHHCIIIISIHWYGTGHLYTIVSS